MRSFALVEFHFAAPHIFVLVVADARKNLLRKFTVLLPRSHKGRLVQLMIGAAVKFIERGEASLTRLQERFGACSFALQQFTAKAISE